MSTHTPGPWRAIDGHRVYSALGAGSGAGAAADSNDAWCICICSGDEVPKTSWGGTEVPLGWGPVIANTRLIAAAPDLLVQLQELVEIVDAAINAGDWKVDGCCDPCLSLDRSRAAIAKAEGRE